MGLESMNEEEILKAVEEATEARVGEVVNEVPKEKQLSLEVGADETGAEAAFNEAFAEGKEHIETAEQARKNLEKMLEAAKKEGGAEKTLSEKEKKAREEMAARAQKSLAAAFRAEAMRAASESQGKKDQGQDKRRATN